VTAVTTLTVHLDDRWDECYSPEPDCAAWPPDGFVADLIETGTLDAYTEAIACILAALAATGAREIPAHEVFPAGSTPTMAALRKLARHGYITLAGE
jgi:hypothetical protein